MKSPWRYRLQGVALGILLVVVFAAFYYRVGHGFLIYLGWKTGVFDFEAPSEYRLTSPSEHIPGVTNYARVSRNLHRGAAANATGYRILSEMGIRTIVDLREFHTDLRALQGIGVRYVRIPMNPADVDDDEVAEFLQVVRNPDLQPVFVHCTAGSDRTGVVVAIYRVMDQHWPPEQAALELPRFGFHEVFQPILHYLKNFDKAHINALAATQDPPDVLWLAAPSQSKAPK